MCRSRCWCAGALLTDDELSRPNEWPQYSDPFGYWHEDPYGDMPERR